MHSSPSKVNDHIWDSKHNIIQEGTKLGYDQTHDHTSISHTDIKYQTSTHKSINQITKDQRSKNTLSRSLWSIHFPPFGNKLPKSWKCIVLCDTLGTISESSGVRRWRGEDNICKRFWTCLRSWRSYNWRNDWGNCCRCWSGSPRITNN